jgi:hypothetical protein
MDGKWLRQSTKFGSRTFVALKLWKLPHNVSSNRCLLWHASPCQAACLLDFLPPPTSIHLSFSDFSLYASNQPHLTPYTTRRQHFPPLYCNHTHHRQHLELSVVQTPYSATVASAPLVARFRSSSSPISQLNQIICLNKFSFHSRAFNAMSNIRSKVFTFQAFCIVMQI